MNTLVMNKNEMNKFDAINYGKMEQFVSKIKHKNGKISITFIQANSLLRLVTKTINETPNAIENTNKVRDLETVKTLLETEIQHKIELEERLTNFDINDAECVRSFF